MNTESKPISSMNKKELEAKEERILTGFFEYWHRYTAAYETAAKTGKQIEFGHEEYDDSGEVVKSNIKDCNCQLPMESFKEKLLALEKIRKLISEK